MAQVVTDFSGCKHLLMAGTGGGAIGQAGHVLRRQQTCREAFHVIEISETFGNDGVGLLLSKVRLLEKALEPLENVWDTPIGKPLHIHHMQFYNYYNTNNIISAA